jgi:hypothetical protein
MSLYFNLFSLRSISEAKQNQLTKLRNSCGILSRNEWEQLLKTRLDRSHEKSEYDMDIEKIYREQVRWRIEDEDSHRKWLRDLLDL